MSTIRTVHELKPCPFCGGEAAVNTVRFSDRHAKEQGWGQSEFYGVNCVRCGASSRGTIAGQDTADMAAEKWNMRAVVGDTGREASGQLNALVP